MNVDDEYEFSECSERAINFFYPPGLTPNNPMFKKRMIELQLRLIECKIPAMFPADKRRALKTIKYLKEELAYA